MERIRERVYKYPCKVHVDDKNMIHELYSYLVEHNYYIREPYEPCMVNGEMSYPNTLVTWVDYNIITNFMPYSSGFAILARKEETNSYFSVDCGDDIELFKKLTIIRDKDDDYDFEDKSINIKNKKLH
jgi:hypothetical protein